MVKKRRHSPYTDQQRGTLYRQWRSSGMTQESFCKKHELNPATFKNWAPFAEKQTKKLGKAGAAEKSSGITVTTVTKAGSSLKNHFAIQLSNDLIVFVPHGFDRSELKNLLESLEGA